MNHIKANTTDALLAMDWEDFLALCEQRDRRPSEVLRDAGL